MSAIIQRVNCKLSNVLEEAIRILFDGPSNDLIKNTVFSLQYINTRLLSQSKIVTRWLAEHRRPEPCRCQIIKAPMVVKGYQ